MYLNRFPQKILFLILIVYVSATLQFEGQQQKYLPQQDFEQRQYDDNLRRKYFLINNRPFLKLSFTKHNKDNNNIDNNHFSYSHTRQSINKAIDDVSGNDFTKILNFNKYLINGKNLSKVRNNGNENLFARNQLFSQRLKYERAKQRYNNNDNDNKAMSILLDELNMKNNGDKFGKVKTFENQWNPEFKQRNDVNYQRQLTENWQNIFRQNKIIENSLLKHDNRDFVVNDLVSKLMNVRNENDLNSSLNDEQFFMLHPPTVCSIGSHETTERTIHNDVSGHISSNAHNADDNVRNSDDAHATYRINTASIAGDTNSASDLHVSDNSDDDSTRPHMNDDMTAHDRFDETDNKSKTLGWMLSNGESEEDGNLMFYKDMMASKQRAAGIDHKQHKISIENTMHKREKPNGKTTTFWPSISAGAITNLGAFFRDLSENVHFNEHNELGEAETRLLDGDHPLQMLHNELKHVNFEDRSSNGKTAQFLHALRTYRPSQKIRSLVSMQPHGYHGSNFIDPNYMWVGLG